MIKELVDFIKENKVKVGIAYAVFMALFYFINIPKAGFGTYVIGFLALTLVFLVFVMFVKRAFLDKKVI